MKNLSILLLGGTGAIGAHLSEILSNQGHNVHVTTRSKRESKDGVSFIQGNAYDNHFVNDLLANHYYDVLVDFMVYRTDYVKNIVCKRTSQVGQHIFLSSARVYADCNDDLITEEHPRWLDVCKDEEYLKTEEYALTKARQEDVFRESNYQNWTIIRPYITYSETRLQLGPMEKEEWLYRYLNKRTIVFSKDMIDKYTTLTYGYDVAQGIAAIIGQKSAYGEAFHITQPKALTWGEILDIYKETINEHDGYFPKVLLTEESINLRNPGLKWQVKMDRTLNRRFDNSKISQYIDPHTFTDPAEGLKKCLYVLLDNKKVSRSSWFYETYKDRLCGELAPIAEFASKKDYIKYLLCRYLLPLSKL